MGRLRFGLLVAALSVLTAAQERPAQIVDARTAISKIVANDPETKIEIGERDFVNGINEMIRTARSTSPEKAARDWLHLVDRGVAIPVRSLSGAMAGYMAPPIGTLRTAMNALPGPASWPIIEKLVQARPPSQDRTVLLMLMARLRGDNQRVLDLFDQYDREQKATLGDSYLRSAEIPLAALRRMGHKFTAREMADKLDDQRDKFFIPKLTDLLPVDDAKWALFRLNRRFSFGALRTDGNRSNRLLAQEAVRARLKEMKQAPWLLARERSDLPLLHQMIGVFGFKAFVDPGSQDSEQIGLYFAELARDQKVGEAAKLVQNLENPPSLSAEDLAGIKNPDDFVLQVQKLVPNKDLGELYKSAAEATGRIPKAIENFKQLIANPATGPKVRRELIADMIELQDEVGDLKGIHLAYKTYKDIYDGRDRDPFYDLLNIGRRDNAPVLIKDGEEHEALWSPLARKRRSPAGEGSLEDQELDLIDDIRSSIQVSPPENSLLSLCDIYRRVNRPKDVISLLDEVPGWETNNLATERNPRASFLAAWALAKTGKKELAVRILQRCLDKEPNFGEAYTLLNGIAKRAALPVYADTIAHHPAFPLPWLYEAELYFDLGKLGEASDCVRRATALDPIGSAVPMESSQYREELMLFEAKMSARRGDLQGAKMYEKRAEAYRLETQGENGIYGPPSPKIEQMMRHAADLWPDNAYLQVRCASCLENFGKPKEAQGYYIKAFECLGNTLGDCTDTRDFYRVSPTVFQKAKKAIDQELRDQPGNSKRYLARGILSYYAGNSQAAFDDLGKAVSANPNAANAWLLLDDLADYGFCSPAAATKIEMRRLDLYSYARQFGEDQLEFEDVSDLAPAFIQIQGMLIDPNRLDQPIYPLKPWVSSDPTKRRSFNETKEGAGSFLERADDVSDIVALYSPTRWPF